jgi:hypothetical protein
MPIPSVPLPHHVNLREQAKKIPSDIAEKIPSDMCDYVAYAEKVNRLREKFH